MRSDAVESGIHGVRQASGSGPIVMINFHDRHCAGASSERGRHAVSGQSVRHGCQSDGSPQLRPSRSPPGLASCAAMAICLRFRGS